MNWAFERCMGNNGIYYNEWCAALPNVPEVKMELYARTIDTGKYYYSVWYKDQLVKEGSHIFIDFIRAQAQLVTLANIAADEVTRKVIVLEVY